MEYLPGGVHGETSKTSKEQRSTVNHVRCFWCGRYLGVFFLTPYVPLPALGSENGPDMINCGSLLSKTKDVSPSSIFRQMVEFGIL